MPRLGEDTEVDSASGRSELIWRVVGFLMETRPRDMDRIVPIRHTMDFSLVWDGMDLIRMMSRRVIVG